MIMNTKINSTIGISVFLILCFFSISYQPVSAQNADNLLLKNYSPVSIYKIPVTHVNKAAYPVIDMHSTLMQKLTQK